LVEDVGGKSGTATVTGANGTATNGIGNSKAKRPNSFVYRFTPSDTLNHDPSLGGKLEALQVFIGTSPITFDHTPTRTVDQEIFSAETLSLYSCGGTNFSTKWVTVHDTAVDTSGLPFDANALAKANGATPFKRPENGVFRPGSSFKEFYFTVTGDTNKDSTANNEYGGWGGVFKLTQIDADNGKLRFLISGDQAHTGLDNIQFLDSNDVLVVEDAGDTLHGQRNALDSGYKFDVRKDYCQGFAKPVRFLAEGRDASATLDAGLGLTADNEITGIHVSNGDSSVAGLLGQKSFTPFLGNPKWRIFWNQQHGDNNSWEIIKK